MFVISWFADGPKWENMLRIPFLSQGLSYSRPFRYRDEWISAEILSGLETSSTNVLTRSKNERVLLCAKFQNTDSIILIREVMITQISELGGEYYIYFRAGRFVDYRGASSILQYSAQLFEAIPQQDRQKLFHPVQYDIQSLALVPDYDLSSENDSWTKFVDLLCIPSGLPMGNVN